MMKKILPLILVILLVAGFFGLIKWKSVKSNSSANQNTILFVSSTCPHCKKVEEWLDQNKSIKEKINLSIKEVYYNQDNSEELSEKANECKIDTKDGIGVPFLYDNGQCFIGDQPIIDYLSQKYQ